MLLLLSAYAYSESVSLVPAHLTRTERRIWPGDGVELVIAEHATRRAGLDHRPHDGEGFKLMRLPVDQIADEDGDARRMTPHAALSR